MGEVGIPELLLILGIALVLFGGKKIPEIGRGLGEGIRGFREAMRRESNPESGEKQEPKS